MKNRIIITSLVTILSFTYSISQNSLGKPEDYGRIVINSFIPDQVESLSSSSKNILLNKLNQITTQNGMGGSGVNPRFIITPNLTLLTKEITPTAPPMTAITLDVTFFIGDGIEGTIFSSESITVKGVGKSETKSYISAINRISPKNKILQEFLLKGKNKIIEYYNGKCDFILKEASTLSERKEYDEAIYKLVEIPEICKDCYDRAMDLSINIFKDKLEYDCEVNLSTANSNIAQENWDEAASLLSLYTPDLNCYPDVQDLLKKITNHKCSVSIGNAKGAWSNRDSKLASKYLSEVSFDSDCYYEANLLFESISSMLDEQSKKEWDLDHEKYKREMNYEENQGFVLEKMKHETEIKRINVFRDIGVVNGDNQQNPIYNIDGWN